MPDHEIILRKDSEMAQVGMGSFFCGGFRRYTCAAWTVCEAGRDWCVEAVWSGDFNKGAFDRSGLIFGSGIRCRDEKVTFVSSGTTLDRLYYYKVVGSWYVSNSLPALLACSGISLDMSYRKYSKRIRLIEKGLKEYQRELPAKPVNINMIVFHNLVYDGKRFVEMTKPDP